MKFSRLYTWLPFFREDRGTYMSPQLRRTMANVEGGGEVISPNRDRGDGWTRISVADIGMAHLEDFHRWSPMGAFSGNGFSMASAYKFPDVFDPANVPPESERTAVRVIGSQSQVGQAPPTIETITLRDTRGAQSLNFFLNDGVASSTIKALYEFVIGSGFEIDLQYEYDETPPWFKATNPEVAPVKRKFSGKSSKSRDKSIFLDYMRYRADELKKRLDLETFAVNMAKDALVTGDGFAYRVDSVQNDSFPDGWQSDVREYLENDLADLQQLNPLAVHLEADEFNALTAATIRPALATGGAATPEPISDLTKLIRLKWGGSDYTIYGVPHLTPALRELDLKDSLLNAAKAAADRFALPVRMLKYGVMAPGNEGGPIATPAMRTEVVNVISAFNPTTDTIAAPFHWDYQLIGAEGGVVDLATQIAECDRRIMMALGIPPNFLDSNYTSFATAKIQFQNMIIRLRQLQLQTQRMLEELLLYWAQMRGYRTIDGGTVKFVVRWKRANLESDPELIRFFTQLTKVPQRYFSRQTIRETLGFDAEIEEQRFIVQDDLDAESGNFTPAGQPGPTDPNAPDLNVDPNDPNAAPPKKGKKAAPADDTKAADTKADIDELQQLVTALNDDVEAINARVAEKG